MNTSELIAALRKELQLEDDEPDEAILTAVLYLKTNLTAATLRKPEDEEAMDIIRRAAKLLDSE